MSISSHGQKAFRNQLGLTQNIQKSEFFLSATYQYGFSDKFFLSLEEGFGLKRALQGKLFFDQGLDLFYSPIQTQKFSVGPSLGLGFGFLPLNDKGEALQVANQFIGVKAQCGQQWKFQFSVNGGVQQNFLGVNRNWIYDWETKFAVLHVF